MGIARNTLWNLLGYLAPGIVALLALPPTVRALGMERYGILALILVVHDYFNYFDFGLGRASTHFLSSVLHDENRRHEVGAVFWTCLVLHLALGLVVGLVFWVAVPWVGPVLLRGSPALLPEGIAALNAAALLPPVLLLMIAGRGALEAAHRFDLVNAVKVPLNSLTFVIPWLAAIAGLGLPAIILAFVAVRLVAGVAYLLLCLREMPTAREVRLDLSLRRRLLSFGGFVMGTNLLGLVLVDGERFLIPALASVGALTLYTIPNDAITRLWILPASLASTLFPIFSAARLSPARAGRLYADGTLYLMLALVPVVLLMEGLAGPLLTLWMGPAFGGEAVRVLQVATLGMMLDSLARIPLLSLQALGHPGVPARIRLWELPAYLAATAICTAMWGIIGAAWVWTARIAVEAGLLFWVVSHRRVIVMPAEGQARLRRGTIASVLVLAGGAPLLLEHTFPQGGRIGFLAVLLLTYAAYGWHSLVDPAHRAALLPRWFLPRSGT